MARGSDGLAAYSGSGGGLWGDFVGDCMTPNKNPANVGGEHKDQVGTITLVCPKCGADIAVPTYRTIDAVPIAVIGLDVIFDPPGYIPPKDWIPEVIRCKLCKTVYGV